jgi:hypothetical protein
VGKYALSDINEDDRLDPEAFSDLAPAGRAAASAIVTVEVRSEHALGLQRGMRLVFVQEKVMVPAPTDRDKRGLNCSQ